MPERQRAEHYEANDEAEDPVTSPSARLQRRPTAKSASTDDEGNDEGGSRQIEA